jgi:hypothetical protein
VRSAKWRVGNKACTERPCRVWLAKHTRQITTHKTNHNTQDKSQNTRQITTHKTNHNTQDKSQHTRQITTRSAAKSSQRLQEKKKGDKRAHSLAFFRSCKNEHRTRAKDSETPQRTVKLKRGSEGPGAGAGAGVRGETMESAECILSRTHARSTKDERVPRQEASSLRNTHTHTSSARTRPRRSSSCDAVSHRCVMVCIHPSTQVECVLVCVVVLAHPPLFGRRLLESRLLGTPHR